MNEYDENIKRNVIDVQDFGIPMDDVPQWNQLSIDEKDESLFTQLYKDVASDKWIIKEDDVNIKDENVNMEVNIHRGGENQLERATVNRKGIGCEWETNGESTQNFPPRLEDV